MVTSPRSTGLGLLVVMTVATTVACTRRDDVTPTIVVSPGAKERIMVMDRFRHHGSPRRLLPKVTVEEVDEAELPATSESEDANEAPAPALDGGAPGP